MSTASRPSGVVGPKPGRPPPVREARFRVVQTHRSESVAHCWSRRFESQENFTDPSKSVSKCLGALCPLK
jgi:hypothetical protein